MSATSFTQAELAVVRRALARQMVAATGGSDLRIEAAFAAVPRENFLGAPPWLIADPRAGYRPLSSTDPVLAYQDVLFALAPHKSVNNGGPSLHARLLVELGASPRRADRPCRRRHWLLLSDSR